jgi:hypothetical protein
MGVSAAWPRYQYGRGALRFQAAVKAANIQRTHYLNATDFRRRPLLVGEASQHDDVLEIVDCADSYRLQIEKLRPALLDVGR